MHAYIHTYTHTSKHLVMQCGDFGTHGIPKAFRVQEDLYVCVCVRMYVCINVCRMCFARVYYPYLSQTLSCRCVHAQYAPFRFIFEHNSTPDTTHMHIRNRYPSHFTIFLCIDCGKACRRIYGTYTRRMKEHSLRPL
jgi:hypothetical protein